MILIKREKQESIKNLIKFITLVLFLSIFACQSYLNNIVIYAHDLGYHLNRIIEISKNLNLGIFPSFIHSGLLNNLGYANSIFYPELFLYIPAFLITMFDLHPFTAYKIFLIIITFFTFIVMFISTNGIFKNKKISWLASLLYTFSLYRLTDIYVRGALGEILSFIFIPLIFYGLYEIIFGENKKWWIISIGLFGTANSHILTFVILLPIILLICLLNFIRILKDRKIFLHLLISAIISITLCIGVFGPIIEQKMNDKFYIDEKSSEEMSILVKERSNSISMTLNSNLKSGNAINSSINKDEMSEGIGSILLILSILIFFRKDIKYKNDKFEIQLFIIGIIFLVMSTKIFPWEKFVFLNIIQFPFRLNIISTICLTWIGAKSFYEIVSNKTDSITLLSIVILIVSGYVLSSVPINSNPELYSSFESVISGVNQTGNSEYLPINSNLSDFELYNIHNKKNKIEFIQTGSKIEFDYYENKLPLEINIPLIYYKGYTAYITDKTGNKTELSVIKNEDNGHILLKNDTNLNGTVIVEYKITVIQTICYILTNLSIITLISIIIHHTIKQKMKCFKNRVYLIIQN